MNRLVIGVLLFTFAWSLQARVYKSVDADGNVTYSQTKPTDSNNVETIKTPKPQPAPPVQKTIEPSSENASTEQVEQKPEINPEEKEKLDAENAEIEKQNCKNSKKRLAELKAAGRIKITDDNGDLKWASEEEIQARKDHLKSNVEKWCK